MSRGQSVSESLCISCCQSFIVDYIQPVCVNCYHCGVIVDSIQFRLTSFILSDSALHVQMGLVVDGSN